MTTGKYSADLHVHSQFSNRPSIWALRRFNCPESFASPIAVYELAKRRGRDYVTITDHNTIAGSLAIAHLPGTFLGTELTAYFPENGCKVHVGVLGLSEPQFAEAANLRKNVYELVRYLRQEDLAHFLAHPLYDINGKLSVEMVEKFLLLFSAFETRNGARDKRFNELFEKIVLSLTPELMERLADRHGLEPYGERSWLKGMTGGSDDHSGLYVGQTYTETTDGATLESFLDSIKRARALPQGEHGGPLTLAHSIYAVAYHFFSKQLENRKLKSYPFLGALLQNMFGDSTGLTRSAKLKLAIRGALPEIYPNNNRSRQLEEVLDREIRQLLIDKNFRDQLSAGSFNRRVFTAASHLANRLLYHYAKKVLSKQIDGGVMDLVNSFSTIGFVHLVTAPYYIAHHSQNKGKPLLAELQRTFGLEPSLSTRRKMALFTDTLGDINGVALTIRRLIQAATEYNTDLTVIGCSNDAPGRVGDVMNFQCVGNFNIPEYPDLQLHFPPVLDVLDFVDKEGFCHIHVSTPGLQGLLGLLIARLMDLPVSGTYHTDIPQYVGCLTADQAMEETAWNYVIWFYNQLDEVLIPSCTTRDQLVARGLSPEKARPLPRWVDTERFSPELRDCELWTNYGADQGAKLLYAGRVSREKNLELLADAFMAIQERGSAAWLVVAGDGPYRKEMEHRLQGHKAIFTGFLSQVDLACVYASADALIFPSTTDTFGNVVLEAQASGLPVVVTDKGGPQELMVPGITGLVVAGNDTHALTEAMRFLAEDHERRVLMGMEARKFALRGRLSASVQFATVFGADSNWAWMTDEREAAPAGVAS
jgi:glycosyltransferase involved in cell wall biosynthesis